MFTNHMSKWTIFFSKKQKKKFDHFSIYQATRFNFLHSENVIAVVEIGSLQNNYN